MVDPIIVGELNSDDERLTDKENPTLPTDSSWLDVEVLDVGAVMELPILTYENSLHIGPRSLPPRDPTSHDPTSPRNLTLLLTYKRKNDEFSSLSKYY